MSLSGRLFGLLSAGVCGLAISASADNASPPPVNMLKQVVREKSYWKTHALGNDRDLVSKLGFPTPELLDYLNKSNQIQGFSFVPSQPHPDPAFMADVRGALSEMPELVRKQIAGKLEGIFIVHELGSSAFTEVVYDDPSAKNPEVTSAFVVLDEDVLSRKANAWLTWKESSPFKVDPFFKIEAEIEKPSQDDRRHAIQYILLHEFGHVIDGIRHVSPYWDDFDVSRKDPGLFPYSQLSWLYVDGRSLSRFEAAFPQRKNIVYYMDDSRRLKPAEIQNVYQQLSGTDFPTLYAATNSHDDFAEAFANYIHVVLMKRPYELRATKEGKPWFVYRDCWGEKRCQKKKAFIERLLKSS